MSLSIFGKLTLKFLPLVCIIIVLCFHCSDNKVTFSHAEGKVFLKEWLLFIMFYLYR